MIKLSKTMYIIQLQVRSRERESVVAKRTMKKKAKASGTKKKKDEQKKKRRARGVHPPSLGRWRHESWKPSAFSAAYSSFSLSLA